MSHIKLIVSLLIPLIVLNCAKLGEASVSLSQQNEIAAQPIVTGTTKPGMGSAGGPALWTFWAKNRQTTSDALVGSFAPFYKVTAARLAVSTNFVLYRDTSLSTLTTSQAASVLATMETAYANLKAVYGAGQKPSANNEARTVILAYDILDDYSTTGNYVGGFFAPRDLYSNAFTTALYTDPATIQQYSSLIVTLGGYSNEMSIIHYDLSPGYTSNPSQVNDIVIHELSHLFTYNRRVVKERLINHDAWIAEGIAENAPHQTLQNANVQQLRLSQLASPSTIDYYQDAPQLTDFATWGPKTIGYIQSNLFFNYLRHRAEMNASGSSATMLTELMTTSDQTIAGLETVIAKYIPGNNFSSIYGDYVITNYLMYLGIPINTTTGLNGGAASAVRFSMDNVQIGNSSATVNGTTIKSKYPVDLPFNYEGPKCTDGTIGLKPNSYIHFRHTITATTMSQGDATSGAQIIDSRPAGSTELPLQYVFNTTDELTLITPVIPTTVSLRTFDATQSPNLAPLSIGQYVQFIVYNPNKTGSCLKFNASLIAKRNHSKWTGLNVYGTQPSPDFEWQSDVGAPWNNATNGAYYRPGGIASFTSGYPNNFLYVTDYTNMSVQKLNLDNGTPIGRLGSTATLCPSSATPWDTGSSRYANNYCEHSFDTPQGVHADAGGNVYVADTNNRRIVKYDAAGNFVGWIGLNGASCSNPIYYAQSTCTMGGGTWTALDGWQTSGFVDGNTLFVAGAQTDPKMFFIPWALTSDATYLYVVDIGAHRITRRNKASGVFAGYVGNGNVAAWATTATATGATGSTGNFFNYPRGIAIDGTYLYVADEQNHRIVRITIVGSMDAWIGDSFIAWQGMGSTPSGIGSNANKSFKNPSGIAVANSYMYITDRLNNRIVKIKTDGTACNAVTPAAPDSYCGWIGHGKVKWERVATPPASDPYAGFSYYPPDYYAEPLGITVVLSGAAVPPLGTAKGGTNSYIFFTSIYNGRVTRVNIGCADAPTSAACAAVHAFP